MTCTFWGLDPATLTNAVVNSFASSRFCSCVRPANISTWIIGTSYSPFSIRYNRLYTMVTGPFLSKSLQNDNVLNQDLHSNKRLVLVICLCHERAGSLIPRFILHSILLNPKGSALQSKKFCRKLNDLVFLISRAIKF